MGVLDEPSIAEAYYSTECQEYALILDEEVALQYAYVDIVERRHLERMSELQTMPYPEYLRTPEWAIRTAQAKARAGYRCMLCCASGELHGHHRTYEHRGVELPDDIVALCADCHSLFHGKS